MGRIFKNSLKISATYIALLGLLPSCGGNGSFSKSSQPPTPSTTFNRLQKIVTPSLQAPKQATTNLPRNAFPMIASHSSASLNEVKSASLISIATSDSQGRDSQAENYLMARANGFPAPVNPSLRGENSTNGFANPSQQVPFHSASTNAENLIVPGAEKNIISNNPDNSARIPDLANVPAVSPVFNTAAVADKTSNPFSNGNSNSFAFGDNSPREKILNSPGNNFPSKSDFESTGKVSGNTPGSGGDASGKVNSSGSDGDTPKDKGFGDDIKPSEKKPPFKPDPSVKKDGNGDQGNENGKNKGSAGGSSGENDGPGDKGKGGTQGQGGSQGQGGAQGQGGSSGGGGGGSGPSMSGMKVAYAANGGGIVGSLPPMETMGDYNLFVGYYADYGPMQNDITEGGYTYSAPSLSKTLSLKVKFSKAGEDLKSMEWNECEGRVVRFIALGKMSKNTDAPSGYLKNFLAGHYDHLNTEQFDYTDFTLDASCQIELKDYPIQALGLYAWLLLPPQSTPTKGTTSIKKGSPEWDQFAAWEKDLQSFTFLHGFGIKKTSPVEFIHILDTHTNDAFRALPSD